MAFVGDVENVAVSLGGVVVPNVLDWRVEDARRAITSAGLAVETVFLSSNFEKNTVIDQSPQQKSVAATGSKVTLTISQGSPTGGDGGPQHPF